MTPRQPLLEPVDGIRITCFESDPDGTYTAHVSLSGKTITVHNRYGAWRADGQIAPQREHFLCDREVLPRVAAALQAKLKTEQRRQLRAAA